MRDGQKYWAFLSYSHRDRQFAAWLHRALETYPVPPSLIGQPGPSGPNPPKLAPIFRDREELAASADLGDRLREAIAGSGFLIVICSPSAADSHWTNEEIIAFKKVHGGGRVLAAIVAGEPNASAIPGREAEECFPPALRFELGADGKLTDVPVEPIAADFRADGDGRRLAKLKLIAGMLDAPLDALAQRDAQRRTRRFAWLSAASLAGMAFTSFLAISAIHSRNEAQFQRAEANGLVEYMLTDLRKKLEPVGKLDTLDGVGQRALAYYEKQNLSDLSPDELGQRATALNLVGETRNLRGDLGGALVAFREAARTTEEQLRRDPTNGERMFDHSQSSYWVGYTAWQRGDRITARRYFTDYLTMANAMAATKPANIAWRKEVAYANSNLGVLDKEEEKFDSALGYFKEATLIWKGIAAANPKDREAEFYLAQQLAWQADTYRSAGQILPALDARQQETAIYKSLLIRDPQDYEAVSGLLVSQTGTARLLFDNGEAQPASAVLAEAMPLASRLQGRDATNTLWREIIAGYWNTRALASLVTGEIGDANAAAQRALAGCQWLVAKDNTVESWKTDCLPAALWHSAAVARKRNDMAGFNRLKGQFIARFPQDSAAKSSEIRTGYLYFLAVSDGKAGLAKASDLLGSNPNQNAASIAAAQEYFKPDGVRVGAYPFAKLVGP